MKLYARDQHFLFQLSGSFLWLDNALATLSHLVAFSFCILVSAVDYLCPFPCKARCLLV